MKKTKKPNETKDILLPNEEMRKIVAENYYIAEMQNIENSVVDLNHLERIFKNETYSLAMKLVPLLERKILYLSYVENLKLKDICKRLKISKNEVISLRSKAIVHFKNNLETLYKIKKVKNGN